MRFRLHVIVLALCLWGVAAGTAQTAQKLVPAGHWVLDAVNDIFLESGRSAFIYTAPLSVAELKLYMEDVDRDALSPHGHRQYERVLDWCDEHGLSFTSRAVTEGVGITVTPELYYRSNPEIDWSFLYHFRDNFFSFPLYFSVADYAYFDADFFLGRNYWSIHRASNNWHNAPINFDKTIAEAFEFDWPQVAYASFGVPIKGAATFNVQVGRGGRSVGRTQTGSIIQSERFENNGYARLSFFSPKIKYTLDVMQTGVNKYLYTHEFNFNFFRKVQVRILEGAYINAPFELRFLNPLMIMHSFSYWTDYNLTVNDCCAYVGISLDYVPVSNLRLYVLYAQNEIRALTELEHVTEPNSFGFQVGGEFLVPFARGAFHGGIEGVYTLPWLYIKHTPDSSLYSSRGLVIPADCPNVNQWIGTPFGPDSIAAAVKFGYEMPGRWSAYLSYVWSAQGENAFIDTIFYESDRRTKRTDPYYPTEVTNGKEEANRMTPSGTPQYTNRVKLEGDYRFTPHFTLAAYISYAVAVNAGNRAGNTQHGVEMALSGSYRFF